jgi:hypothetical protein
LSGHRCTAFLEVCAYNCIETHDLLLLKTEVAYRKSCRPRCRARAVRRAAGSYRLQRTLQMYGLQ